MPALKDLGCNSTPQPVIPNEAARASAFPIAQRWARGEERNLQFVLSGRVTTTQTVQAENVAKQYATCR